MKAPMLTQTEALAEVIRALETNSGPDAFTRLEFQEAYGYSESRAVQILRQLKAAGRLTVVKVRRLRYLDDQRAMIPAYVLVTPPKAKK